MRPIKRRAVQKATGGTTEGSWGLIHSARRGEIEKIANTPIRAIAISRPMARAISFPSNHFAIALLTVMPAISHPHPNIMNPKAASLALPGIDVHHELSHSSSAVPWNRLLIAYSFMHAPATISDAERVPVKRTPILSRMIPARIRNPNTLSIYSAPA